jgi:hypothetical protein
LLALALVGGAVHAGEPAPLPVEDEEAAYRGYSGYEQATIDRELARLGARIDPAPEGKIVEAIEIIPLDVIEDRDPAPEFLNWFHVTSWPYVIRRDVLLAVGRPYRQALSDETARNLRSLDQLSLVLVLAAQGSRPDRVRVVVIAKDVWSLRLNSNYRIANGKLEYLFLQPSEQNLLGSHHAIVGQMLLEPASIALGAGYVMPHVGGSHIVMTTEVNFVIGRETGELEGSYGGFAYGQPLYSTEAEWSWKALIAWRNEISRRYVGGEIARYDAEATPAEEDAIPYVYRSDIVSGTYTLTRSFGRAIKHDVSVSAEGSRRVYRPGNLSAFAPAAAAEFTREALPVSDTRIGPAVEYHTYSTRFTRVLDFNTLALQEDYRLGHDLSLKLYPVLTALRSSRDFMGVAAAGAYTVPLGDGLARAVVESVTEMEEHRIADASIQIGARVHTPRFILGRLVFDAFLLRRYRNYLNKKTELGGETRLRGYPTLAFIGPDVIAANLEYRTRPLEIWSVQLGGAAFFDVGDAFDGFEDLRIKQSAGFGLRVLFPQLGRTVMRADWGFPLTRGYVEQDSFPGDIVITFRQAFPMPAPAAAAQ